MCVGDGCILALCRSGQRIKSRQPILYLLECGEHRLAVIGDRFLISRLCESEISPIAPPVEDGLQQVTAQRPERAGCANEGAETDALEPPCARDGELRVKRVFGGANECVLLSHGSFRRGYIGPPLQQ